MAIYKKGNSYEVRISYKDIKGNYKQHHKTGFKSKEEAEDYIASFKLKLSSNTIPLKNKITFFSYFKEWYETYKEPVISDNTKRRYRTYIREVKKYFNNKKLCEVNRKCYQLIINDYGKTHVKTSVTKFDFAIRAMAKSAILDGLIDTDFTKGITLVYNDDNKIEVDYLNLSEIKATVNYLIENLKYSPKTTNNYIFILTGFLTGMRLGEIQALTWEDIDFENNKITINKSWDDINFGFKPPKTKASNRVIDIPSILSNILKDKKKDKKDKLVFFNNTANRVPVSQNINKSMRRVFKRLGISRNNYHFHSVRHSYVALAYSLGIDFYTISKQLGHANPTTTINTYSYLIEEFKQKQTDILVKKLDKLFT